MAGNENLIDRKVTKDNQTNGTQKTQIADPNNPGRSAEIDVLAKYLIFILSTHHQIHEGIDFSHSSQVTLGNGATRQFIFVTPNITRWAHFNLSMARSSGEANISIHEGVTADADGTSITPINSNRNSATTSVMTLTHTPTNPVGTTLIFEEHWGNGKNIGGQSGIRSEMNFKQNTRYLITITSEIAANDVSWVLNWYEHLNV